MQRKYADSPPQFADIGRWCGFFMSLRGVALKYLCLKYTRVSPMIDVTGLSQRHLTHIMLLMEDLRER